VINKTEIKAFTKVLNRAYHKHIRNAHEYTNAGVLLFYDLANQFATVFENSNKKFNYDVYMIAVKAPLPKERLCGSGKNPRCLTKKPMLFG
jgi:hypothetical protein